MSSPPESFRRLRSRIDRWQDNIDIYANESQDPVAPLSAEHHVPKAVILRRSARLTGLQEISVNQGPRKRKRDSMSPIKSNKQPVTLSLHRSGHIAVREGDGGPGDGDRDSRGGPYGKKDSRGNTRELRAGSRVPEKGRDDFPLDSELPMASRPTEDLSSEALSFEPPRSASRPSSPRKGARAAKPASKALTEAEITLADLKFCNPPVDKYDWRELRENGIKISKPTEDLYQLIKGGNAHIPLDLRPSYHNQLSTPPKASAYLSKNKSPYDAQILPHLQTRIAHFHNKARFTSSSSRAPEGQWGALVCLFLDELETLSSGRGVSLNMERIPIQPEEMRPLREDRQPVIMSDVKTQKSMELPQEYDSISRMVDWSFGFKLPHPWLQEIIQAWRGIMERERSLNQTSAYCRFLPLIFDIEVKKTHQPCDPQVQLAVWASGALLKKRWMGWDRSLPMPGITVEGHIWELFLFYELDERLIMAGPIEFGSTSSLEGTWAIMHRLHILMKWGTEGAYMEWFRKSILAPACHENGHECF